MTPTDTRPGLAELIRELGLADSFIETLQVRALEMGRPYEMGEYYDKTKLKALGEPIVFTPSNMGDESPCELYARETKEGKLLAILLTKSDSDKKSDMRKPLFMLESDIVNYYIAANIGYLGHRGEIIKAVTQFPTDQLSEMSEDQARDFVGRFPIAFFTENYDAKYSHQTFTGWRGIFDHAILTQIKADNGCGDHFNPMYFLIQTKLSSHTIEESCQILGLSPGEIKSLLKTGNVTPKQINQDVVKGHLQHPGTVWWLKGKPHNDKYLLHMPREANVFVDIDTPAVIYNSTKE